MRTCLNPARFVHPLQQTGYDYCFAKTAARDYTHGMGALLRNVNFHIGRAIAALGIAATAAAQQGPISFQRDIRPILSSHCYVCHGPDEQQRKAGLRLDLPEAWQTPLKSGEVAIVPGDRAKSVVFERIHSANPDDRMPPEKFGKPLSADQIALIDRWIDEGAPWEQHWAFAPLSAPMPPSASDPAWPKNPIDQFVLATLDAKGMKPSPEADRRTLIRRLTYDLHGLPPTPEAVDAFVNDPAPDAYERLVDALLASPRYGERWGRHWLDVAHYADTHGYDKDKRRPNAWPYRDYVIRALNDDMPYHRFVSQQLAGDVLEPGNPDGVIALGFISAGPWDFVGHVELREGTVEKKNTRLLDRDDMVASAMNTFVSMTAQCARCHDHKFDPISQRDYYGMQAVFAGVERANRPYDDDPAIGRIRQASARELMKLTERKREIDVIVDALDSPELKAARETLAAAQGELDVLEKGNDSPTNGYHSLIEATQDTLKWVQLDFPESILADKVKIIPARPTDFADTPGFGFPLRFKVEISDDAAFTSPRVLLDQTGEDLRNPGDDHTILDTDGKPFKHVRMTATRLWPRSNDFVFALAEIEILRGEENVGLNAAVSSLDSIESGRWAARALSDGYTSRKRRIKIDPASADLATLKDRVSAAREQRDAIVHTMLAPETSTELKSIIEQLALLKSRIEALPQPKFVFAGANSFQGEGSFSPAGGVRDVQVLRRGDVNQPIEAAVPGAIAHFAELQPDFQGIDPKDEGQRRAALARWITDHKNPLTWRSIVNRVWHYHIGRGIVDTPNDFGYMGSPPRHPELLNWLAATFRDSGQSLKQLHRLIVTSATYRQSSANNATYEQLDAGNQFLWRMNRTQLDAESIRDSVLAVTGMLNLEMGGSGFDLFAFEDDHSPRYKYAEHKVDDPATLRRTVYRFIVRSVPDPLMETLDCADPSQSVPVRNNTITALQALAILNNPFMVAQAQHFAERIQSVTSDPRAQIVEAYRLAFNRAPTNNEIDALSAYATQHGLANACRVLLNSNEFIFID